ncbi:hypothetical protein DSO57_1019889 [Entomophthora muscae]|uniref:Uncharacterized protein n=1 Tax=Entomophthora muscae TaxID=34485 RepID=A0ACC2ST16_9FUNG|nr:hypothetical protein DSO57_1019889 [Entomophthora muscae]
MKTISILSFLTAAIQAQVQFPHGRIVGGYEVTPSFKYPWIASLQYYDSHACGGTWYSGNAIISAAHCAFDDRYSKWKALGHRHNLDLKSESENGLTYSVLSYIVHPKYNLKGDTSFDVSIWKVNANASRPTIELDSGNYSGTDDTLLTVIGWGSTSSYSDISSVLLEVKVPVFNSAKCKKAYPILDTLSQYCAGYPEGKKDSCQGDSGGPMFVSSGDSYTLVGVVSWGKGCALKGYPGIYTRISAVSDFIAANI